MEEKINVNSAKKNQKPPQYTKDNVIQKDAIQLIKKFVKDAFGMDVINIIPLYNILSIICLKGDRHYNLQIDNNLNYKGLWGLKYNYNANGTKIVNVVRIPIKQR